MTGGTMAVGLGKVKPEEGVEPPAVTPSVQQQASMFPVRPVMPRQASYRELVDTPEMASGINRLYKSAQPSFARQTGQNRLPEILEPIGTSGTLGASTEGDRNQMSSGGMRTIAAIPNDSLGIMHSHPYGEAPQPSDQDYVTAKKLNRPNYEISANELYVAEPDSGNRNNPTKIADLRYNKGQLQYNWNPNIPIPKPEKFTGYTPMKTQ